MERAIQRSMSRRQAIVGLTMTVGSILLHSRLVAQTKIAIVVYKDPNCGCCHLWVQHMAANGFAPAVTDTTDMRAVRLKHRVGTRLEGCHTALVGGYVIEGHVPAADVKTLLSRKPTGILGLTIPGMPQSAPGMDVKPFQPYTVLTFDAKGATTVFARHDHA